MGLRKGSHFLLIKALPLAILAFYVYVILYFIILSPSVVFDFQSFWVAARLALDGRAAEAYSVAQHAAGQQRLHGNDAVMTVGFAYPPFFLLACMPLGLLSYGVAAPVWVMGTLGAFIAALRAMVPSWGMVVIFAAFPAVYWNILYGQNGFLTAALFALVVHNLGRRPLLAGLCIGLLAYKPHLGVAIPLALAVGGRWATFTAASLTIIAGSLLATLAFGPEIWTAFLGMANEASGWLAPEDVYLRQMATVFAAVLLLEGGQAAAYAVQFAVACTAIVVLVKLVRRRPGASAEGAAIVCCAAMCTPYLLRYDMVIMTVPLAWLWTEARRTGFLRGEKAVLVCVFAAVAQGTIRFHDTEVLLAPIAVIAVFATIGRRIMALSVIPGTANEPAPEAAQRLAR
jgi:hypothetical protein